MNILEEWKDKEIPYATDAAYQFKIKATLMCGLGEDLMAYC
jgi:hypothetical protein